MEASAPQRAAAGEEFPEIKRPARNESPQQPDREGVDAVKAAARNPKGLTDGEKVNALDWFLSDDAEDYTHTMELNVGSTKKPKWIEWTMRPVDLDTLRRIRKQSQPRAARRGGQAGEIDEVEANLRIVIEGTVDPDILAAAKQIGVVDPADALRARFQHKPGLLGQIAGEIMSISGYDDEDVREVDAAGNS